MKQHITKKQFSDLPLKAQERLFKFFFPRTPKLNIKGCGWRAVDINPEYLTIGRLIEFLYRNRARKESKIVIFVQRQESDGSKWSIVPNDLCDDLWEAVKGVLNV